MERWLGKVGLILIALKVGEKPTKGDDELGSPVLTVGLYLNIPKWLSGSHQAGGRLEAVLKG